MLARSFLGMPNRDPAVLRGDILPAGFFARSDESDDAVFYGVPRLVTHVDDATIAALTTVYRELIAPGSRVLDLLSSWVSHLPAEVAFAWVAGQGMNAFELENNPRLNERLVHDLNRDPSLPFAEASFDVVLNAFSMQYLVNPLAVLRSVGRVLRPGGLALVALSHRMFPTKAVAIWHPLDMPDRARLVGMYFRLVNGWSEPELIDRSPVGADPLWVVAVRRAG